MYIEEDELDDRVLYQVWTDSPDGFRVYQDFFNDAGYLDLPDPYPFDVGALPGDFLDQYSNPARDAGEDYWARLQAEGIRELVWRRQPRHIGPTTFNSPILLSSEVFDALSQLAPGNFVSEYSFDVVGPSEKTRLHYHSVSLVGNARIRGVVTAETLPDKTAVDGPRFFSRSSFRKRQRLGVTDTRVEVLAGDVPRGFFTIEELPPQFLTTAAFIRSWRSTSTSEMLRKAHFDDDFYFVPYELHDGVLVHVV